MDDERAAALTPWVEQVFGMLDGLDAVALGETPSAFRFNSRWPETR